jgi:hypothetical protein
MKTKNDGTAKTSSAAIVRHWKDYAAYIGGKGRYWTVKFKNGKWMNIYEKGNQAKKRVEAIIDQLEVLS